jgi:hypothetical protein
MEQIVPGPNGNMQEAVNVRQGLPITLGHFATGFARLDSS